MAEKHIYITKNIDEESYNEFLSDIVDAANLNTLNVHISSNGGSVYAGFKIYEKLKELRNQGVNVITYAEGQLRSIAEQIFFAGKERVMYRTATALSHAPTINGNKKDWYKSCYDELLNIQETMFNTRRVLANVNVSDEEIWKSINEETVYSAQDYLNIGYATKIIDNTAFAKQEGKHVEQKQTKMEQNETTNSLFKKMDDLYNVVCNSLSINRQAKNSSIEAIEVKNLVLSDVKGNELDFYEFKEGQQPSVGAKVTVNGSVTTSTHILSNGKIYEVVNGVLDEVKEVSQEFDAMKQSVENMKKQLEEKSEKSEKLEEVLNISKREIENLKQEFSAALIEKKSTKQVDSIDAEFKFKRLF